MNFEHRTIARLLLLASCLTLLSCQSEIIRRQEAEIRRQREEIVRQQKAIEEVALARQRAEQKRQDCNQAFRLFEEAQAVRDPHEVVSLYREGLALCPDDDVAHYELGKILRRMGRIDEADKEFEATLKINPNFTEARRELEGLRSQNAK